MKTILPALALGTTISLALFWLMQMMISHNQQGFEETDSMQMTEFIRLKRDPEKLKMKERVVEDKPPPPEKRPPPPQMQAQQTSVSKSNAPQMDMPNLDIPLQTERFSGSLLTGLEMAVSQGVKTGVGAGKISTGRIPLVNIEPRYPRRARNRHIEGWVKIEFMITKEGLVKDAKVVDSKPGKIFNRAALKVIKRWKFKPKVVNGVAVEQRAIQKLDFKLGR